MSTNGPSPAKRARPSRSSRAVATRDGSSESRDARDVWIEAYMDAVERASDAAERSIESARLSRDSNVGAVPDSSESRDSTTRSVEPLALLDATVARNVGAVPDSSESRDSTTRSVEPLALLDATVAIVRDREGSDSPTDESSLSIETDPRIGVTTGVADSLRERLCSVVVARFGRDPDTTLELRLERGRLENERVFREAIGDDRGDLVVPREDVAVTECLARDSLRPLRRPFVRVVRVRETLGSHSTIRDALRAARAEMRARRRDDEARDRRLLAVAERVARAREDPREESEAARLAAREASERLDATLVDAGARQSAVEAETDEIARATAERVAREIEIRQTDVACLLKSRTEQLERARSIAIELVARLDVRSDEALDAASDVRRATRAVESVASDVRRATRAVESVTDALRSLRYRESSDREDREGRSRDIRDSTYVSKTIESLRSTLQRLVEENGRESRSPSDRRPFSIPSLSRRVDALANVEVALARELERVERLERTVETRRERIAPFTRTIDAAAEWRRAIARVSVLDVFREYEGATESLRDAYESTRDDSLFDGVDNRLLTIDGGRLDDACGTDGSYAAICALTGTPVDRTLLSDSSRVSTSDIERFNRAVRRSRSKIFVLQAIFGGLFRS